MKNRMILLASLSLLACSEQPGGSDSADEPSCSERGVHRAILSTKCIADISRQVIGKESTFFTIVLDNQQNLFIQGATLPDGGLFLEIPGPRYAQIEYRRVKELQALGFRPNLQSGNFTLILSEPSLRGNELPELVMNASEKLGFSQGETIGYEVALLAFADE